MQLVHVKQTASAEILMQSMLQAEVLQVLAEGQALHLLPPCSLWPELGTLCVLKAADARMGPRRTPACQQIVMSQLLLRSLSTRSLAADIVISCLLHDQPAPLRPGT